MHLEPYLHFTGQCAQALEFYEAALQAKTLFKMQYKDSPETLEWAPEGSDNWVLHATLQIGEQTIMASDGPRDDPSFRGVSLSITPDTEDEAKAIFNGLAEGGEVQMPLGKTFFSPCFGTLVDQFGVNWMVCVEGAQPE